MEVGRPYLWTYACIAFWVELRSKTENIRFQRDTWEFTGAWFYFLRANAKCNLHLWWENTCWATGWPCVSIAALWLEVLHVQYVKLILLIYRLFSIWSNPATLPKMWNGPATTSGISGFLLCVFDILACLFGRPFFFSILGIIFGFDFGPNFGYHFCPYFWGVLQKKGIDGLWKREQKLYPKLGSKFNLKNLIQKLETNQCRHQRRRDRSCLLSLDHCKSLAKSPGVGSNFKNDRLKKERMEHIANERVQSSNKGEFDTWPQCCSTRAFSRKV